LAAVRTPSIITCNFSPADGPKRRRVSLGDLRPTQGAVGMRAVAAKRQRIKGRSQSTRRIESYLGKRVIPAILGPEREVYMLDRHHMSLALHRSGIQDVFVSILADLSAMPRERFWRRMERDGLLHPYDATGARIHPSQLPTSVCELAHDPYRDLAWSVRRMGGFKKTVLPFSEFRWANFFRARIARELVHRDYGMAVRKALCLTGSRAARALPGYFA
jgi:hypothetical protein